MTDQEDTSIAAVSKGHHELVNVVTCMARKCTFHVKGVMMSFKEKFNGSNDAAMCHIQPCLQLLTQVGTRLPCDFTIQPHGAVHARCTFHLMK